VADRAVDRAAAEAAIETSSSGSVVLLPSYGPVKVSSTGPFFVCRERWTVDGTGLMLPGRPINGVVPFHGMVELLGPTDGTLV
jgi:hypothetical protein